MINRILFLVTLFVFTACASFSNRDPASNEETQTQQRVFQIEMNGLFNQ
jgi:hypothetical protein